MYIRHIVQGTNINLKKKLDLQALILTMTTVAMLWCPSHLAVIPLWLALKF